MPTLKELSIMYAKKQPTQVDNITEEAPILGMVDFQAASHGLWNAYEETSDVTGASFVQMNAALPTVGANSELKKVDLSIMGGEIECPEDKAQMFGGAEKYFATKLPKVLRASGQNAEVSIVYDNFRKWAVDKHLSTNKKLISAGASGTGYSMVAVRFVPGETCGLFSPEGFSQGAMVTAKGINGGNLYKNASGVLVYGIRLKAYLGIQIANTRSVAAIVNIDSTHVPTKAQIDDLLDLVRANNNTYIFCHPKVVTMLSAYRSANLTVGGSSASIDSSEGKKVDRRIESWNDVPFVKSYNFLDGTETAVTVA